MSILELVELAKSGASLEHGMSVGHDDPDAVRFTALMEQAESELESMLEFLERPLNKGIADLPAISIYKLRAQAPA